MSQNDLKKEKYELPKPKPLPKPLYDKTKNFFLAAVLLFSSLLFGQSEENTIRVSDEAREGGTAQNILDIKDYEPLSRTDNRFYVSKPSFSRQFAVDVSGEYLNVSFYLRNYTTEPIALYLFISAYYESDMVDTKYRKWVPHTKWRKRDIYKEHFIVNKVSIVPKDILPSLIWDHNDPDHAHYAKLSAVRSNFVSTVEPLPDLYPPIWKYLEYIKRNSKTGAFFTLHGAVSPPPKQAVQFANAPALLYERGAKAVMSKKPKPKYTMEHSDRLSIIHSYHFSSFQRSQNFFNRVVIQIFDARKIDLDSTAGEISHEVFKKVYSIKVPYQNN